jgi:hypothetical protein
MDIKEVSFYEVYNSNFDIKVKNKPVNIIAVIPNSYGKSKNYSINNCSDKNYGFMMLKPISETRIVRDFLSIEFKWKNCRQISVDKVNLPILIKEVEKIL